MFRPPRHPNLTSFSLLKTLRKNSRRYSKYCPTICCNEPSKLKVTICGACGRVGQILGFLLKQSPFVNILSLYDLENTMGMAMDISHIDTKCRVQSYSGWCEMTEALMNSNVVLVCAGIGRAPGMSVNDLFEYNAPVVKQIAEACIHACPTALIGILTNPINSLVPMVSNIYKIACCYDSNKIFGITAIDAMRASSIVTNDVLHSSADPAEFLIPVIGGHSEETIVPLLSQTSPPMEIPECMIQYLMEKIRGAASLVVSLKENQGGPRLSVALGAARFTNNLLRGLRNERAVVDMAYVYCSNVPGVCYFCCPIELGPSGMKKNLGMLKVDPEFEKPYLQMAIQHLKCDIRRGENYVPCD